MMSHVQISTHTSPSERGLLRSVYLKLSQVTNTVPGDQQILVELTNIQCWQGCGGKDTEILLMGM